MFDFLLNSVTEVGINVNLTAKYLRLDNSFELIIVGDLT